MSVKVVCVHYVVIVVLALLGVIFVREQYGLLRMLQAVERPAYLDPVFKNAQTWEALSVKEVFSNK